jgi:hypothetical protein
VSLPLPLLLTPPQQEYLETTLQRLQEENEELRRRLREVPPSAFCLCLPFCSSFIFVDLVVDATQEEEKTMKLRTGVEQTESVKTELQKRMKKLEKALHEKVSAPPPAIPHILLHHTRRHKYNVVVFYLCIDI